VDHRAVSRGMAEWLVCGLAIVSIGIVGCADSQTRSATDAYGDNWSVPANYLVLAAPDPGWTGPLVTHEYCGFSIPADAVISTVRVEVNVLMLEPGSRLWVRIQSSTSHPVGEVGDTGGYSISGDPGFWGREFTPWGVNDDDTFSVTIWFDPSTSVVVRSVSVTVEYCLADTTPPTITASASDQTVECDGSGNAAELNAWLASHGGGMASDESSGVAWSDDFAGLSGGCGATGSATVTFTATDDSGNSSMTRATFTVEDTKPPTITAPASSQEIACDGSGNAAELSAWLASHGGATASDACGQVSWSDDFSGLSDDCREAQSVTVVFTATDDCGNTSTTSATFSILPDTAPPILVVPPDVVISCGDSKEPSHAGIATATDDTDPAPALTYVDTTARRGVAGGRMQWFIRTWIATDAAGNASYARQQIAMEACPLMVAPLGAAGFLDRGWTEGEVLPFVGELVVSATYEVGELISGCCSLVDGSGAPVDVSHLALSWYAVTIGDDFLDVREPIDSRLLHEEEGAFCFSIPTSEFAPGYYDIRLGVPFADYQWIRVEVVAPAE